MTTNDLRGARRVRVKHSLPGIMIGSLLALVAMAGVGAYAWETWPTSPPLPVVSNAQLPDAAPLAGSGG